MLKQRCFPGELRSDAACGSNGSLCHYRDVSRHYPGHGEYNGDTIEALDRARLPHSFAFCADERPPRMDAQYRNRHQTSPRSPCPGMRRTSAQVERTLSGVVAYEIDRFFTPSGTAVEFEGHAVAYSSNNIEPADADLPHSVGN